MTEFQRILDDLERTAKEHWLAHAAAAKSGEITRELFKRMTDSSADHERAVIEYDKMRLRGVLLTSEGTKMRRGKFVTFEGIDGSGKSTQILKTQEWLGTLGIKSLITREPGGTGLGDAIRTILLDVSFTGMSSMSELLLMFAAPGRAYREGDTPHPRRRRCVGSVRPIH